MVENYNDIKEGDIMNPSIWKRLKDNRINKEVLLIHRLKAILGR